MDKIPLNFELMKNPVNWVILSLMVAIAGLGLSLLFPHNAVSSATPTVTTD